MKNNNESELEEFILKHPKTIQKYLLRTGLEPRERICVEAAYANILEKQFERTHTRFDNGWFEKYIDSGVQEQLLKASVALYKDFVNIIYDAWKTQEDK